MTCAYNITTSGRSSDTTTGYALDSVLGANTWNGSIVQNGSGGACGIVSGVGTLTINGNVGGSGGNRYIDFAGAGNITVNGNITNSSGYTLTVYGNGPGTVTLAGANTFNGACGALGGTLSVSSLNYVSSGNLSPNTSSSLGKPSSAANGIITLGNTNISAGTLRYTGTGETTDRQINLGGTTNGATIDQSGMGLLMFTGNFTTLTVGSSVNAQKTLTLQGSTAGTGQIAGNIGDSATGNPGQMATSVTKAGTGTWTLSGANTYSGATTINAGELVGAVGGSSANSAVSVAATSGNTAVLGVSITNTNNQWTCSSLTVNNGGTSSGLDFNFGALTPGTMVAPLNVSGSVTFSTPSQTTITIESGNLPASPGNGYPLITWGSGSAPATNGMALRLPNRIAGNLAIVGNTLYLQITGTTEPLSWKGGAGTWDVNDTTNTLWQDNTGNTTYFQENKGLGDSVVFDNTVGLGGTITLNTNVIPASVTANNSSSATAYTISGSGAIVGGRA